MQDQIRLTNKQKEAICKAFLKHFAPHDKLWLFGSRADPNKKGGDIDLYIESSYKEASQITNSKQQFLRDLYLEIGPQKIDVVIKYNQKEELIHEIARNTGIRLV